MVGHGDEIGEWGFAIGKHSRSRLAASADAVRFHESPIPIPESRLFIYAHHQFQLGWGNCERSIAVSGNPTSLFSLWFN
ncbi:exonuclease III [Xanthomonas oryzae pv. oryzicola BLS256]|uniref:Exonuclease III n=1 Tax=Xanthomonas oryzae pv. oryzicola (strain BLS256) TaxID=383407 RepID=G7TKF6_XANOB|nr:exonuclease III [Xanthomonas oryzae pv. oryzicola BLS256]